MLKRNSCFVCRASLCLNCSLGAHLIGRVSDLFDTKNLKLNWFLFINKYEADNQSKFREKKIKTPENEVATSWVDLKLNKM